MCCLSKLLFPLTRLHILIVDYYSLHGFVRENPALTIRETGRRSDSGQCVANCGSCSQTRPRAHFKVKILDKEKLSHAKQFRMLSPFSRRCVLVSSPSEFREEYNDIGILYDIFLCVCDDACGRCKNATG